MKLRVFSKEFAKLLPKYRVTKYPIVLCHGLLGFDELRVGDLKYSYWNGVKEVLEQHGARVLSDSVPPAASIERRAEVLAAMIKSEKKGYEKVNLVAHSMGGLDGRYLISKLANRGFEVQSLTTIATPHHGSPVADVLLRFSRRLPVSLGAFAQLSTRYMTEVFNKQVQNREDVAYFSYGAEFSPSWASPLRIPWGIINKAEGANDGLVSVKSAMWGKYEGTIFNCDHLDVINLSSYKLASLRNHDFNPAAMYLHVMDDLASQGF